MASLEKRALKLLLEWRKTEYFNDAHHWRKWVESFGPRVDRVLKEGGLEP